ncbi:GCN5 family acetyltransferase [Burkholderia ubonensis]|uniref:GNAT family N-acetyltransferase n=1 Tax=Burkholderia ubonensis TaxID=101571 RepID=UPI00075D2E4E|nr:GNAT family N-acetyltransferase [Burkholderia ubonensis]KVT70092.1 GCN5 family acetyltransferase [Burkholderia ubonensis]
MTNSTDIAIQLTNVEQPELRDFVSRKLDEYNDAVTGMPDNTPLDIVVTDRASGEVLGGLTGRTSLGLFFISLVYLPETLRKRGLGSELLRAAEAEAKRRGCISAFLYTISFQAPEFYEKHGYKIFGEVPCLPAGTSRVFMAKTL